MSKSFSETVESCISEFLKTECVYNLVDGKIDIRKFVKEHQFLPILLDCSGFCSLRPNGEMIWFDLENVKNLKVETDKRIRNIAMASGVKRFPELLPFLPKRTESDIDCDHCESIEQMRQQMPEHVRDGLNCYCGGLGWIPNE